MSRTAYIFPGQGAQKVGMGKAFYDTFACSKRMYDMASDLLSINMKELCFEENERLNQTEFTQCALVTTELAILEALKEQYGLCQVTGGLSLGEYSALAAAGVLTPEDAILLVRKRGILMEQAVPAGEGAMSAVLALDTKTIETVLDQFEGVEIANYNCPGQIVISGKADAVKQAGEALQQAGAKRVVALNVSGPFHSSMLMNAGAKLGEALANIEIRTPQIPYTANVTGAYVTEAAPIRGLLEAQVSSSVRWQQCVETMLADGVDTFVEIGPQKTLCGFLKKINRGVRALSIETPEQLDAVVSQLKEV